MPFDVLVHVLDGEIGNVQSEMTALKSEVSSLQVGSSQGTSTTPPASTTITMVDLISMVQPVIVRVDVTGSGFQASGSGIIRWVYNNQ